jgi:hypothetical protein
MITIEDFTIMAIGFVAPLEGEISCCPVCGRNGIVKRTETEEPRCIHAEATEVFGDGTRTEPTDCCRLSS